MPKLLDWKSDPATDRQWEASPVIEEFKRMVDAKRDREREESLNRQYKLDED